MRRVYLFLMIQAVLATLNAQDTINLRICLENAKLNAPRYRDSELIRSGAELKQQNIGTSWLPSLNLNGKATWQSDVVEINFENAPIPLELPAIPKDQYSISLDVRQMIYDGGLTKKLREYELSSENVDLKQVEVDLFTLKDQVNQSYLGILLLQENRKNLELTLSNLKEREKVLESAVSNGLSSNNDLLTLRVEILKLLQALDEIDSRKSSLLATLNVLTGMDLSEDAVLEMPYFESGDSIVPERPELELFRLQQNLLDASIGLKMTERMPKLYAFGQAGYGRPGYNMLSSTFDTYYMAGIMLQWNIWDWKKNSRERQMLEQKQQMLTNAEEQFTRQLYILTQKEKKNIAQYRKAMDMDDHIVSLQQEVTANAASQLENGVLNSSSYLLELNRENAARISRSVHKIQLVQALSNIMIINGLL